MTVSIYREQDVSLSYIRDRRVAIVGFGAQGQAHATNLRDSGVKVIVGLKPESLSTQLAKDAGFEVADVATCVESADLVSVLAPDEVHGIIYQDEIAPNLKRGGALLFAHGFSIHYQLIEPREDLDVILVAPKGPGALLRKTYTEGSGLAALLGVHQNTTGQAKDLGLSYAAGLGCAKIGILETTFKEEVETDLFGEQVVLCGGVSALVQGAFETLVEAGYAPEMAYLECLHELKLITDLLYEGGLGGMRDKISNTAEFGDYTRGPRVVDEKTRQTMKTILAEIQSGQFAREFLLETRANQVMMKTMRRRTKGLLIEKVGRELRGYIHKSKSNS